MYRVWLDKFTHARETGSLVDTGRALVEYEHKEPKGLRSKLFSGKGQSSIDKRQAQAFAGEIRAHAQTDIHYPVLSVESWHVIIPHLGRGSVAEKADQLAPFITHCVVRAARL